VSDHDAEYVRGLPEALPEGERILWQGVPGWAPLARTAFHVRGLSFYFAVLMLLRAVTVLWTGGSIAQATVAVMWLLPLAGAAIALLYVVAWLTARATVYTITSKRVVMRIGVVLEITLNFPFRVIESAGLRVHPDGTGDIPLVLSGDDKVAYVHLWPHARPWRAARPEPMLRSVPEAVRVAEILARALAAQSGVPARPIASASRGAHEPATDARPFATAAP
jgi:hypothetical protein